VESIAQKLKLITLIIVYGVNKPLREIRQSETIEQVKLSALALFNIPAPEQTQYVLKTKINGKEVQLDESKNRRGLRASQRAEGDSRRRHTLRWV